MEFLLPQSLIALLLVLVTVGFYVLQQRRRSADAERFGLQVTRASVVVPPSRWRHLPPLLFLLATSALVLGAARPIQRIQVPQETVRVILTMDVSGSMDQNDVSPTRMAAAVTTADQFARDLPPDAEVGLVAFSSTARLEVPPTRDRERLTRALEGLNAKGGTAIGDALQTSLAALAPQLPATQPQRQLSAEQEERTSGSPRAPAPQGTIVLLTDGDNNVGSDPAEMAERAAALGIRVYTIGLGNPDGVAILGSINEGVLAVIAARTGASYQRADSREGLREIYQNLAHTVVMVDQKEERAWLFALGGMGLALAGSFLTLVRANRVY